MSTVLSRQPHLSRLIYSRGDTKLMANAPPRIPHIFGNSHRARSRSYSLRSTILEGSWDSHIHIIDPVKYPLPKTAKLPQPATMVQALANADRLGLANMVFVQISTYGDDNTWVLDALKEVGSNRGRGVVSFDPEHIDCQKLHQWHDLGVRGVRLNFRSSNKNVTKATIQSALRNYANKIRPMKTWSIGLYADMECLDYVYPLIDELQVKIVLEHFASPAVLPSDRARQPGWDALQRLMDDSRIYAKISAPYLFSNDSDFRGLESLGKWLLGARNGDGVVFGSDWPHTQSRGYNVEPFMDKVLEWCNGDEKLQEKLFRENAKRLWDV